MVSAYRASWMVRVKKKLGYGEVVRDVRTRAAQALVFGHGQSEEGVRCSYVPTSWLNIKIRISSK